MRLIGLLVILGIAGIALDLLIVKKKFKKWFIVWLLISLGICLYQYFTNRDLLRVVILTMPPYLLLLFIFHYLLYEMLLELRKKK